MLRFIRSAGHAQGLHRSLGAMHRLEVSVCPREQQRAFDLTEYRGGDQIGVTGLHAEALEPAFELLLPALEGVTGGSTEDFGLRRSFQGDRRDRTTFRVAGAFEVPRHRLHDTCQKIFNVVRRLRRVGDYLADSFPGEPRGGLADFFLAARKMKIEGPARRAGGFENVVERRAVIAPLAEQFDRRDDVFCLESMCSPCRKITIANQYVDLHNI